MNQEQNFKLRMKFHFDIYKIFLVSKCIYKCINFKLRYLESNVSSLPSNLV